jgi:hypothetical protein
MCIVNYHIRILNRIIVSHRVMEQRYGGNGSYWLWGCGMSGWDASDAMSVFWSCNWFER